MSNRNAVFRLAVISVLCICAAFTAGYQYITIDTAAVKSSSVVAPERSSASDEQSAATVSSNSTIISSEQQTSENKASEAAVSVAATGGDASGRVVSRFISPYTANTSYGSIYLKNSTDLKINLKELYEAPLPYTVQADGSPQVLIMHTHTTESFLHEARDYYMNTDEARSLDDSFNMVALGNIVADKLNSAGIVTLHDITKHDYPSYNGSYTRAAETINGYLKKYPSIKIVIDLHRDAIAGEGSDKVKPVATINGKQAAQLMIVMGSQSGTVTGFENWRENLKLAVKLQRQLEGMYPSLARALSLMPKKYNENLTTGSMLIEIGTEVNSIDEVKYSAELLGNALAELLGNR